MNFVLTHCPFCSKRLLLEGNQTKFAQCLLNDDKHHFSIAYDNDWKLEHYIIGFELIKVYWVKGEFTVIIFPEEKPGKIKKMDANDINVGNEVLNLHADEPTPEQLLNPKGLIEKMKSLIVFQ